MPSRMSDLSATCQVSSFAWNKFFLKTRLSNTSKLFCEHYDLFQKSLEAEISRNEEKVKSIGNVNLY